MSNFITNGPTKNLLQRLEQLIACSKELKFLVGFFYFSGIKDLYKALHKNEDVIIRICVGLNVDTINYCLVECGDSKNRLSKNDIVNNYFESLKKSINSDEFDNKEFYQQITYLFNYCLITG